MSPTISAGCQGAFKAPIKPPPISLIKVRLTQNWENITIKLSLSEIQFRQHFICINIKFLLDKLKPEKLLIFQRN